MFTETNLYLGMIVLASVIVIAVIYMFFKKRNDSINHVKRVEKSNKLIDLLGGFDNIVNYEFKGTRFKVELKDLTLASKEGIQALGANGIMEVNNTLQIILGAESKKLKEIIGELDK